MSTSTYEKIRCDIRQSSHFRFNWFLRSRTTLELKRRCQNLLMQLSNKETQEKKQKTVAPKPSKADGGTKKAQKRKADKMSGVEDSFNIDS